MMKIITVIGVAMVMLSAANQARPEVCGIVNGSFEEDGSMVPITSEDEPNGWSVDIPADRFGGYVHWDSPTDGSFNLTLHSARKATFTAGDMATVSQQIDLSGVSRILFDVQLTTESDFTEWDPNICTAVVLIDGDVAWDSNSAGLLVKGSYPDQVCVVGRKYRTAGPHSLSLGIRINVDEYLRSTYITHWDMVDCNFCPGVGTIEGDIDGDCCVDANDLKILADLWLSDEVDPNDPANLSDVDDDLSSSAIIDFRDFAIFSLIWDGDMTVLKNEIAFNWLLEVDPDYEYNLFGDDDIRPRGEINFFDIAVLGDNWLKCGGG